SMAVFGINRLGWGVLTQGSAAYIKATGAVKTFRSFGAVGKSTLVIMFLAGWILLGFFAREDLGNSKWWHGLSYIPNIAAGFTGFLIGAPVALVLLASFTIDREDRTALDRVNRLTKLAWNEFRDSVNVLCNESRIYGVYSDAIDAYNNFREVIRTFDRYRQSGNTQDDFNVFNSELRSQLPNWQEHLAVVNAKVKSRAEIQLEWSAILASWSTLDQYVRLQRLERNLQWFDRNTHADIRNRLSDTANPVEKFSLLHDEHAGTAYDNVSEAFKRARVWADLNKHDLDKQFLMAGSGGVGFPWYDTSRYATEAYSAQTALRGLLDAVNKVEQTNWPQCATEPTKTS
ncbi:hypothetical protein ACX9NE_05230, partial [Mycobacterium sp. ML4]